MRTKPVWRHFGSNFKCGPAGDAWAASDLPGEDQQQDSPHLLDEAANDLVVG